LSDKDFKVKNKLVVNGLTGGAGPLIANSNKEIDSVSFLTTLQGGTGTTTSPSAGQVLYSAGGTSYNPTALNTLDVKGASYSADAPSNPVVGQVWIESDTDSDSFDPNIIRRKSFTATAGQTTFTTDLEFIQGYEQVFFNGMLLVRNNDYTTTNNTTVVLTTAAAVNDVVEVVTITNLNSINAATTTSNTFVGNQTIQGSVSITGVAESVHVDGAGNGYRIRANASNNNAALQFSNNSASTDWGYIGAINANKMVIRRPNGANTGAYDSWLNINGGTVLIRDVTANNEEASDWPVPSLSVQSYDTYFENTMFGLFLRDDNPYTLDFSKWVMRLSHGMGDTTSSSSTNLKFGGPGALQLFTGNTERMRITSAGNVGIGTTDPGYKVDIQDSTQSTWYGLRLLSAAPVTQAYTGISLEKGPGYGGIVAGYLHQATGSGLQILTNNGGTVVEVARAISNGSSFLIGYTTTNNTAYKLQVNSQIFATSSSIATSDGRYKENINTITSGLDIVDSLRPVSFTWKDHPVHNFVAGKTVGFIAQEVKESLSQYDWVDNIIKTNTSDAILDEEGNEVTPAEEFLGIAESNIIPLLVAAVKELKARVETLEAN
jgi:hypothetical protein